MSKEFDDLQNAINNTIHSMVEIFYPNLTTAQKERAHELIDVLIEEKKHEYNTEHSPAGVGKL